MVAKNPFPILVLSRGLEDTLGFFKWDYRQIVWPVSMLVGCAIHWYLSDQSADGPKEQMSLYLTYSVAGPFSLFALILTWNMLWAPYRIKRDRVLELEAKLGNQTETNILLKSSEFSIQAVIYMLLGPNPTELAAITLRENISDFVRQRRISKLRNNEKFSWLVMFAPSKSDFTLALESRISKQILMEFIESKELKMPEGLK